MKSMLKEAVIDRIKTIAAAATGVVTSDAVDMAGFNACLFIVTLGTLTSAGTVTCKLQQSSDDGSADTYADIEGSSVANSGNTATLKQILVSIIDPRERYLKLVATRAVQNCGIDSIQAIKYNAKVVPITDDASVDASVEVIGPDEGTA